MSNTLAATKTKTHDRGKFGDRQQVLVVVASVGEQEVVGEMGMRQSGRGVSDGGAEGGVEREQGKESE
jgi:hypothetical protein